MNVKYFLLIENHTGGWDTPTFFKDFSSVGSARAVAQLLADAGQIRVRVMQQRFLTDPEEEEVAVIFPSEGSDHYFVVEARFYDDGDWISQGQDFHTQKEAEDSIQRSIAWWGRNELSWQRTPDYRVIEVKESRKVVG